MMKIPDILNNIGYALLFGFMGLIAGIWTADLLYSLFLENIERITRTYILVTIIVLIIAGAAFIGFTKGKSLLETDTGTTE